MPENIDPTWLAWAALEHPIPEERVAAGLERIEQHYSRLVDYELERRARQEGKLGIATIADADSHCRWPHFAEDAGVAIASAYAPTGWERLVAESDPQQAPLALARALLARPEDSDMLNAPSVLAALDRGARRLLVLGDAIGAGRIYQMRFDGCIAWSNRAGALPLLAGEKPAASEDGWRLLAAASWPLGRSTPLAGVRKSGPGTRVEVTPGGITQREREGLGRLVNGGDLRLGPLADEAAEQARSQAMAASGLWDAEAEVDLSGGRDSRVVAAAVVAAGIDARLHTSDVNPGEADVARHLVDVAPRPLQHDVKRATDSEVRPRKTPLLERARNVHLVHDGMRHPQKLRGEMVLPRRRPTGATLSGHGGEIAHGFFYKSGREARRLRRGGGDALVERVMRFFAKGIGAARPEVTERAREEVEASLAQGRELGLDGPVLLDYFYLVDRFAHRSGVGAHAERISVFTVPAFVRAAFSLSPRQRVGARLHEAMISRLVPEWSAIPFYAAESSAMPRVRRLRLWESADDAAAIEALLEEGGSWEELYVPDRLRAAWAELRAGGGAAKWETAFEGIAYRAAFDDYLSELAAAASVGPPLIQR